MNDQRVLVTAGAAGIGREIARAFATNGAKVFVCDIDVKALDALAHELKGLVTNVCDISKRQDIERMMAAAISALGGLDVLVNNAGISGPTAPVEQIDPDLWEKVMQVDLTGTFNVTRLAIPHLKKSQAGVIINMSSVAGRFGYANRSPYVTPGSLLLFAFLIGAASAVVAPAWQSVVPQLVPRADLPVAVTANSIGINISRAVGPALGGVITAAFGIAAPFWINAFSNLEVIGALKWWRPPPGRTRTVPAERFASAIRVGIRHARNNAHLRSTLLRACAFFLFASAYWALLPLIARNQVAGGPTLYGLLLGAIGAGAVGGAFVRPWFRAKLGPDGLVAAGTIGTAVALFLFGTARAPAVAVAASLLAGVSWTVVLSTLNVSAQIALPEWVRGRGLAMFVTLFSGTMALGSMVWGQVASLWGLPLADYLAAAGAVLAIPLTWRWKLQTGAESDLSPSMHWPTPLVTREVEGDQGPVLVTVEYWIDPKDRHAFLTALEHLTFKT